MVVNRYGGILWVALFFLALQVASDKPAKAKEAFYQLTADDSACESGPIGVSDRNIIPDSWITATSHFGTYYDKRYRPQQARLNRRYGWGPRSNAGRDYLQIDLGAIYNICAIATQGAGPNLDSEWVITYQIRTSIDNSAWSSYNENQIFNGNRDRDTIQKNTLDVPTVLRSIRFVPLEYHVWKTMRVEVYGEKIKELKGIPVIVNVSTPTSTSIIVKWKFSQKDLPNGTVVGYKIVYSTRDSSNAVIVNEPQETSWQLDKLAKYTTYSITVAVRNQWNAGSPSTAKTIRTQEDVPDGVPTSVTITFPSSTSIRVTWRNPSSASVNGRLVGYQIVYKKLGVSSNVVYVNTASPTSYLLDNLNKYTSYTVTVAVRNNKFIGLPSAAQSIRTKEDVPDGVPTIVRIISPSSTSIRVTWTNPSSASVNGRLFGYKIVYTQRAVYASHSLYVDKPESTTYLLENLKKYTPYTVSVAVRNNKFTGLQSHAMSIRTKDDVPDGVPTSVTITFPSSTSIRVTWKNPSSASVNGRLVGYQIVYKKLGVSSNVVYVNTASPTSYLLDNLNKYTSYTVTVAVRNNKFIGLPSAAQSIRTKEDVPDGVPTIVRIISPSSTSIRVTWTNPSSASVNGRLFGYKIVYTQRAGYASHSLYVDKPESTTYLLENLKKYTPYTVSVAIRNNKFTGLQSHAMSIRTKDDVPDGVPTSVTITSPSSTSIRVSWRGLPAASVNGRLVGYQILYKQLGVSSDPVPVNTATSTSFLLKNLKKYTSYTVSVAVRNNKFTGRPSHARNITTKEDVPSIGPSNVHHSSVDATTFNIRWDNIASYRSNGIVKNYEVQCTLLQKGKERRSEVQQRNTTANNVEIHGLELCAKYSIKVRAYTRVGPGPYSGPLIMLTSEPGSPQNVRADLPGKRTVKLKWKKPLNVGDDVQSYTIEYSGSKSYWDSFDSLLGHAFINELKEEHTVRGLIPGTRYGFRISATTDCGKGPESRQVFATTKIDVPIAPEVQSVQFENKTDVMVNITLWLAEPRNGPISAYQVIALKESKENRSLPSGYDTNISDYETSSKNHLNYYIAAQLNATSIGPSTLFLIGDGKTYNDYENVALKQGQSYQVFFRAMTFENGITYAGKEALVAKIQVAQAKRTGSDGQHGYSAGAAAGGGVVAVIILFLVMAGVIFWRRKRKDKHAGSDGNDIKLENLDAELNRRQNIANSVPEQLDDTSTNDHRTIPTTSFTGYVSTMKSNDAEQLKEEYKKLPSGLQFPSNVAKKPVNKHKNRYGNIVPYDRSRVMLECVNDDANSDYINASYLHGYDGRRNAYIASQGPVPPAFNDFWRMIWEQNTASIVMLTNLKELGKVEFSDWLRDVPHTNASVSKCHQYWPNETEQYGDITVNNHKTEVFPDYVIRTFIVSRVREGIYQNTSQEKRWVRQFHFTVWPDKGVPQYATAILAFIRKVVAMNTNTDVPIVVHCSAGVGRTGTYIVIDAMLQRAKKLRDVDIFNYVTAIRNERPHMVQTNEQYAFIHFAILEAITCGNTEIQAQDLNIAMRKLAPVNRKTMISGYATEFQRLGVVTSDSSEECDVGRKPENTNRNRTSDIIPLNRCRVMLHAMEETDSDYINASFVDAYKQKNAFIMTQAPLENTIQDFWSMVLDYKIGTIVMLNDDQEENENYPRYWPKQGAVKFGQISVEKLGAQYSGDIISRRFRVSKDSTSQDVQHFQHIGWVDKCIPTKPQSVIELLNQVQSSQQKSDNAAVVVQCSNGVGRSGTFCAISSILKRLKQEQVVDVFQTVKCIRVNRPGAVESLTQYVFCYQIIQKYLDSFSNYANFTAG